MLGFRDKQSGPRVFGRQGGWDYNQHRQEVVRAGRAQSKGAMDKRNITEHHAAVRTEERED